MRPGYLLNKTWPDISRMLDMDERWLRRQHEQALKCVGLRTPPQRHESAKSPEKNRN